MIMVGLGALEDQVGRGKGERIEGGTTGRNYRIFEQQCANLIE